MRMFRYILLVSLLLTSACASYTSIRRSADYQSTLTRSNELLVLPAEIAVSMVSIGNSTERMYNYEYHLEEVVSNQLKTTLQNKGYRVKSLRRSDIHHQHLSDAFIGLRQQYNAAFSGLYTPPLMKQEQAFSITRHVGDKAVELGQKTGSKLLVMVDYSGAVKTNGARVKDFALDLLIGTQNSANVDSSTLSLSVIDTTTGNIIWSNIVRDAKNIYISALDNLSTQDKVDEERINRLLSAILLTFPDKMSLATGPAS